jgi:hypothetical protein
VGQALRCDDRGLSLSGDPVVSKVYKWFSLYGDFNVPIATTREYVPTVFDIDSYLSCQAEFSNSGGATVVYSKNDSFISGVAATPIPSPTVQVRIDSEAPVVKVVSKSCGKRVCKVVVEAQDASGVLSVEAFYNKKTQASSTCKGVGCVKSSSGTLAASAIDSSRWLFTFNVPRKGSLKLQLQVRALDLVGNLTTDGANVVLNYKGARK